MRIILKLFVSLIVLGLAAGALELWFDTYINGQYYRSAGIFLNLLVGVICPLAVLVGAGYALFWIKKFDPSKIALVALLGLTSMQNGCNYANANVQTLISDNCGVSWTLVQAGKSVPARVGICAFKVTIPDYPMQGDTSFKTSFKERVLAEVEITYEYMIVDGIKFIGEAKYLGKPNSTTDDKSNSATAYESAENTIIDKRIRDVTTELLIKEDIVEFSQADFEDRLLDEVNKRLADKGVKLNFITFVPTPEEQTRLAIDMMTAMKVYQSKGLAELGQQVAVARASATKIVVTTVKAEKSDKD